MKEKLTSIIIRTKNEERWIKQCLTEVFNQTYKNIEVIIVDNCSTDKTLEKIKDFPTKIIKIKKFLPGKSINDGIRESKGEYIVCLSGHCIPTNKNWLKNLLNDLIKKEIAGVYGRQEPLSFTNPLDKRDLFTVFGLDKRVQIKDFFFHNANSAIRREVWEKFPFDECATNIEDRIWGKKVINYGMKIIYEPLASVYHWHGINHALNHERADRIIKILENINRDDLSPIEEDFRERVNLTAIIPIKGHSIKVHDKFLLEYTLDSLRRSKSINNIIVSTDCEETAFIAKDNGAEVPFLRPGELSSKYTNTTEVLKYSLEKAEEIFGVSDLICYAEETYPFRYPNLIDDMVEKILKRGEETIIAVKKENRSIFIENEEGLKIIGEGFIPTIKKQIRAYVGLAGLATISRPSVIRENNIYKKGLGVLEIKDPLASIKISSPSSIKLAEQIIERWWQSNYKKG